MVSFSVFNRYGQEVYNTTTNTEGWNGEYLGANCEMGIYYYFVKYIDTTGKHRTIKGDVLLIR